MASKLRRVPLFGIDSGFSILSPSKNKVKTPAPAKVGKGVFKMDCEVTANYPNGTAASNTANGSSPGRPSANSTARNGNGNGNGSTKSQLHVDFIENNGEVKEKREKYLTAKYGSHQMNLIRKRLAVEMWLYDEIQKLFEDESSESGKPKSPFATPEIEIDLDEVLDLDGDTERRKFIKSLLIDVNKSPEVVNKFIDDVLEKAGTL